MRVLIDTTFARRRPYSGTAVYLEQLRVALGRIGDVDLIDAANATRPPPAGGGLGSIANLLSDLNWTSRDLPRLARRARADLIHHPLPARVVGSRIPQVITVHDLAFERVPQSFDRRFRAYARRLHRAAARSAAAVICVSEATAADVEELWGVDPARLVVARHGPGQEIPGRSELGREHFLYVGDAEPRKNLATLLGAYGRYRQRAGRPLPLILAGQASSNAPGVNSITMPDRKRLSTLYLGAVALIQPSLYEGFGLTALEAMTAGTPVIASDIAGLKEVCGQAALYFDPRRPDGLADALTKLADTPQLQTQMAEAGRRRAAEFSWDSSARAHVAAYSLALGKQ